MKRLFLIAVIILPLALCQPDTVYASIKVPDSRKTESHYDIPSNTTYGWINGVPVVSEEVNFAWINGKPYGVFSATASFVPQIKFY